MKINNVYHSVKENLPEITKLMEDTMLSKIKKSKKVNELSTDPTDWEWSFEIAQRIQAMSFHEMLANLNTKKEPVIELSPEEKVYNTFKDGDYFVSIQVKNKNISFSVDFPKFDDPLFYVPTEIVDLQYNNKSLKELSGYPTIYLLVKQNSEQFLQESYIVGGLKTKQGEYILLKHEDNFSYFYQIDHSNNNLLAVGTINVSNQDKIKYSDFKESKELKYNGKPFISIPPEVMVEKLNNVSKWIQHSASVTNVLLSSLNSDSGFMQIGNISTQSIQTIIPENIKVVSIQKDAVDRSKFKIK